MLEPLHSHRMLVWLEETWSGAAPGSQYSLHIRNQTAPTNRPDPTARERSRSSSLFAQKDCILEGRQDSKISARAQARIMDQKGKQETSGGPPPPRLDCIKCFDALWFCYSPFHQMQSYYRYGEFDNCFGKWGALIDCLSLKTKRVAEVEEILIAREKAKPHIWTYRTVDEASKHWWRMYRHMAMMSPPLPGAASPPPKPGSS